MRSIKNAVQNPHHLNKASRVQCLYLKSKTSIEARAKRKICNFMAINRQLHSHNEEIIFFKLCGSNYN